MPVPVGVGYVDIKPDLTGFGRELRGGVSRDISRVGNESANSLKSSFSGAAKASAAAFGAAFAAVKIKDFIGGAIGAASDMAESVSKVGVVFGTNAGQIKAWAEDASTSFGQSKQQALEAAGTFGNLFTALGLTGEQATEMSMRIVELASDLASFNNIDPAEALIALRAGLVGETEPLRRLGVNMNEATLKAKPLELGLKATGTTLAPNIKAQAAYALIMEQTTTAQGDFARTSEGLANQQRVMSAQWEDMKADIGEGLMPVMVSLAGLLNETVIPAFKTLFLSTGADATGWAATLRDVLTDVVGFAAGTIAQFGRLVANMVAPLPFGDDWVDDLRAGADALDGVRPRLHASTGELLGWDAAAESAAGGADRFALATRGLLPELKGASEETKELSSATRESDKATRDAATAERDYADAKDDYNKLLRQGAVDEEKVADARQRLTEATRALGSANRTLTKAQDEYNDAQAAFLALPSDTNADNLADATDSLADATDGVASATEREHEAAKELDKARAGDPDYQDKLADAKDRVADAQDRVATTAEKVGEKATAMNTALTASLGIVGALNSELEKNPNLLNDLLALDAASPPTTALPAPPAMNTALPSNLIGIPNFQMPTSTNKTVNVTLNSQVAPEPAHLAKAIAWEI